MNFCKMCGEPLRGAGGSAGASPTGAAAGTPPGGSLPANTQPGNLSPVVTPAKGVRVSLPSALAAVVGSAPKKPGAAPNTQPTNLPRRPPAGAPTSANTPALAPTADKMASVPSNTGEKPAQRSQQVSVRTCGSCGAQTPSSFSFCQQCGAKLEGEPTVDTQAPISSPPTVTDAVADTLAGSADIVPLVKKRTSTAPAPATGAYGRLVSVQRDGSDGNAYTLAEDVTDIGRTDGALHFDDRFLAARHARIERRAASAGIAVVLQPLDTMNGVFVRLRLGETYPLVDGDVLLIGKEVLRFEVVEPEERALVPAIQHGVRLFGSPIRTPWARLRQIVQTGATRDIYHLSATQVVLGREEGDLRFSDDEFMSRRHARIVNRDGRFETTDLESSNGTFVRVRGERTLRSGDLIRMGDQLLRYEPLSS